MNDTFAKFELARMRTIHLNKQMSFVLVRHGAKKRDYETFREFFCEANWYNLQPCYYGNYDFKNCFRLSIAQSGYFVLIYFKTLFHIIACANT